MSDQPAALVLIPFIAPWHDELGADYVVHYPRGQEAREAFIAQHGHSIEILITNSTAGASAELLERLPALKIIGCFSAGYENLDIAGARRRGIPITTGLGSNADSVADMAMALMLAAMRRIVPRDQAARTGGWKDHRALLTTPTGKRLGLLGLGHAGKAIARRASGFDMVIGYHKPAPTPDLPHRYFDSLLALAAWSDILIVACPGGPATQHIVNAAVLDALGRDGYLINISRGSVVHTDALVHALRAGSIAGAGLDVYEDEPIIPRELWTLENTVLSPHVAGFTHEAFRLGFELLRDNLRAHFAGRPLLTPLWR